MNIKEINSTKKFKFGCVYLWTNLVNEKKYVGSTKNFYNRIQLYKQGRFNPYMKQAINKYGLDNFDITIIEKVLDEQMLTTREQFWIEYYQSYKKEYGYNICRQAGNSLGCKHTQQTKELLRNKKIQQFQEHPELKEKWQGENNGMFGKTHDDEWKKEHSDWLKEKWQEEEYRAFWSERMSGANNPMYGVHLIGELNPMFGKHHSKETREKIAKALKGKPSACRKQVQCVETQEIFESATALARYLGVHNTAISACLDKPNRTCKKLHFITLK